MKNIASLKDIVVKGEFGGVQIGMTEQEVKELLGEPSSVGQTKDMGFTDFFCGWYEIFFYDFYDDSKIPKVAAFQNDSLNAINGFEFENDKIKFDPWFLKFGMNLEQVQKEIKKEGLEYVMQQKH